MTRENWQADLHKYHEESWIDHDYKPLRRPKPIPTLTKPSIFPWLMVILAGLCVLLFVGACIKYPGLFSLLVD